MIQRSVKNRSIAGLARLVLPSDSTSTRNAKHVWHSFIPDAAAIETDSRLLNHALIVVLGVSPGYDIVNKFLLFFSCFLHKLHLSALYSSMQQSFLLYIQLPFLYTFISYTFIYCYVQIYKKMRERTLVYLETHVLWQVSWKGLKQVNDRKSCYSVRSAVIIPNNSQ